MGRVVGFQSLLLLMLSDTHRYAAASVYGASLSADRTDLRGSRGLRGRSARRPLALRLSDGGSGWSFSMLSRGVRDLRLNKRERERERVVCVCVCERERERIVCVCV